MLTKKLSCDGFRRKEIWASYVRNCTAKLTIYGTLESTIAKLTSELTVLKERQMRFWESRNVVWKVLEELRTKVIGLGAEVNAGMREREDWYLFSFHSIIDNLYNNSYIYLSSGWMDPLRHPILLFLLRNPSLNCVWRTSSGRSWFHNCAITTARSGDCRTRPTTSRSSRDDILNTIYE